ncbi:sugar transferase [Brevibacillus sp. SYSU BS000544]|uniref:sugar transferase n=1 Tax=Brevibacillus sp. SYSU BS000544 TaxID=3416443 RepID=UPI003CE46898
MKWRDKLIKRIFDIVSSFFGLILISPIILFISIWIKVDSKGPIFFRQKRVGQHGVLFDILKFRTMVVDAEKKGKQITVGRDPRITNCGYFLRKYKLDELPQLFNVLRGEMSLVGPRPEVPYYVKKYSEKQKKVLKVKPGITDLASIKYSDESIILAQAANAEQFYIDRVMPDKLDLNLQYAENATITKDIHIILMTIAKILK